MKSVLVPKGYLHKQKHLKHLYDKKNIVIILESFIILLLIIMQLILRGQYVSIPQPFKKSENWKLVFDDEFNGTSLDTTKWKTHEDWYTGPDDGVSQPVDRNELAAYDPAQISVSNGTAKLTLVDHPITINGHYYQYRTGFLTTATKVPNLFGPGKFIEARLYLPPASKGQIANWPGWWASGPNWPTNGETDVMEGFCNACWHFITPNLGNPSGRPAGNYTGWHVFGASWLNNTVTFYYDGVNVGSATTVGSGMVANPVEDLILVNAIGANGYSGPVVVPATMEVDYVRVWQLCTSNCTPQST